MAAVAGACPNSLGRDEFELGLFFNTDVTTVFLAAANEPCYVTSKVRKELRAHSLHVSRTADQRKARALGVMPTIGADNTLLCMLIYIKDSVFKTPTCVQVCMHACRLL